MSEPFSGHVDPVAESAHPAPPRRLRWLVLIVSVVVLVGAGITAAVLMSSDEKSDFPHPANWAAEVLPLVSIVEKERDLSFHHPVYVDFLPDAEFRKQVTADEADLTTEDRKDIEQSAGLFRAIGLLQGDVDLFAAMNGVQGSTTVGYYSFDDGRIRMRGETLTAASTATLVHELTHALQDQHFDLGKKNDELKDSDTSQASVFDAIVEGDAQRVQTAYESGLSEDEQAQLQQEQEAESNAAVEEIADLPPILSTMMWATYEMGEAMIQLALALDDNDAVNELFSKPPVNDEHVFDPWTTLVDHDKATKVDVPKLATGEVEIDHGEWGSTGWYFMLAARLPVVEALDATDGWGGDQYVSFERDGTTCVRMAYVGETPEDTAEFEDSLGRWMAAQPGSNASVDLDDDVLTFESCDPGTEAEAGSDHSEEALSLIASRTYLAATFIAEYDAEPTFTRCYVNGLVHEFTMDQLNDDAQMGEPAAQATIQRIGETCEE